MNKNEILTALELAKEVYIRGIAAEFDFDDDDLHSDYYWFLAELKIEAGLCDYFKSLYPEATLIIEELNKEVTEKHSSMYWYTSPGVLYSNEQIATVALQPRLDHLNRTIARLEKELAAETINPH